MQAAWEALGGDPDRFEIMIMQLVNLHRGRRARADVEARRASSCTLDDLIDDIGVDAARCFLLQRSHDTTLDLDLELAREQSQDNPVYYVQYAHARIASILRKAGEERVSRRSRPTCARAPSSCHPSARALAEAAARASRRGRATPASGARRTGSPTYAHELAQDFSAFYRDCKVVGAAEEGGDEDVRLALVRGDAAGARALARPARGHGAASRCSAATAR